MSEFYRIKPAGSEIARVRQNESGENVLRHKMEWWDGDDIVSADGRYNIQNTSVERVDPDELEECEHPTPLTDL